MSAANQNQRSDPPSHDVSQPQHDVSTSPGVAPPSAAARPTEVNEAPQQASTQPDSGATVQIPPAPQPSFKEQVVGHAKEIRGSILRKPETKEYGQKILKGEASYPPRAQE